MQSKQGGADHKTGEETHTRKNINLLLPYSFLTRRMTPVIMLTLYSEA